MPEDTTTTKAKLTAHLPRARCTPDEREQIEVRALDAGLSLSEYLRRCALNTVMVVRHAAFDKDGILQLSRIGNNLNQIARALNSGQASDARMIARIENELDELRSLLDVLINGSER